MQSTTPAPQEPTLSQKQARLSETLARADRALARRLGKSPPRPDSKAVTLEDHILEASDEILRISSGFQSVLTLLDLQSDTIPESIGLHALLLPLKQQLDQNANRLQALV